MKPPSDKPASFDRFGQVPSELEQQKFPFDLFDPENPLSKRTGEEALEACLNEDFSALHEILENLSAPDYALVLPEIVRTPERKLQNSALMALVCQRLAGAAVTGTLANGIRKLLAGRGADAQRLCWLGYVLGRRAATESHGRAIESDLDRIWKSSQMDRKGKRRADPWNDFISARQMERWATGEKFFTPAAFIKHYGGEERMISAPDGSRLHQEHLTFSDPQCEGLPPISKTALLAKVRVQKRNL
jgi:hypothetical protein